MVLGNRETPAFRGGGGQFLTEGGDAVAVMSVFEGKKKRHLLSGC